MPKNDQFAFDRGSVRTYDQDGRLRVEMTNISKSNVCGYLGSEIPDCEALGLDPRAVYQLLRDPEELEKAAPTFNGIPLLDTHVPSTAWDHPFGKVVGTTGTDAVFEKPYLKNSLVVWTQDAIQGIENGEQRELSCGYRYRADMTPGTFEGESFQGVMRDILGNHVALVATGRAGPDVIVGDSKLKEMHMSKKALSRKAALAKGALMVAVKPLLAADAKLDLTAVLQSVNNANWSASKPKIIAAIKPSLAADADVEGLMKLLDNLDGEKPVEADDDPDPANANTDLPAVDANPLDEILAMLKGKVSDEDHAAIGEKLKSLKLAAPEAAPVAAKDAPNPIVDKPEDKPTDKPVEDPKKEDPVDKPAMDAAIKQAEDRTIARMRGVQDAEAAVQPYVGKLAIAADTAEGVYKAALEIMGINVADVHPSAFKVILESQPKPGASVRIAVDSARPEGFADRFPGAVGVRKV